LCPIFGRRVQHATAEPGRQITLNYNSSKSSRLFARARSPCDPGMGRKPYESDFEVAVFDNTIAVRFWPTRSLYIFRPFHHRTGDRRFLTGVARPCHSSRLPQRSQASIRCSRSAGDGVPARDGGSSGRDVSRGGAALLKFSWRFLPRALPPTPRAPPCSSRSAVSTPSSRGAAYDVRDANGHALAFVYSRDSDAEARQAKVAVNIARLPELLGKAD
jgi:hypothetical protein